MIKFFLNLYCLIIVTSKKPKYNFLIKITLNLVKFKLLSFCVYINLNLILLIISVISTRLIYYKYETKNDKPICEHKTLNEQINGVYINPQMLFIILKNK